MRALRSWSLPFTAAPVLPLLLGLCLLACPKTESTTATAGSSAAPVDSAPLAVAPASAIPTATAPASAVPSAVAVASATTSASADKPLTAPRASAVAIATVDAGPTCGTKPLPDCPLQAWMKANTAIASASGDLPALAVALDKIAGMAPPGYANWASISKDGATAARGANLDGARASCTGCHKQYRDKFRAELRTRPVH